MKTKKYNYGDYFQKLFVDKGKVIDTECNCSWGKFNRKAWKEGNKICEHLSCALREYHLEIINNKKEKGKMIGLKKCPEWLKHAYKKAVEFTCEDCKEVFQEKELEIHRIIQNYKHGTYRPGNVKILCKECHKNYAEEW